MSNHSFGWKADIPDFRDKPYLLRKVSTTALKSVDLRLTNAMPLIRDQLSLGSCTGFGWAYHITFNVLNKHEENVDSKAEPFSPLFIYYQERVIENTVSYDSGAFIRDGIKAISKLGVCYEETWPYVISKYKTKPIAKALTEGLKFKAVKYQRIDSTDKSALVNCLLSGFPIVHGFTVYESFESATVSKTGVVPLPKKTESVLGGHCTVIIGYDKATDRFICANSWGTSWGAKGYYTIPAAYLTNFNLADDFWTCTTIL